MPASTVEEVKQRLDIVDVVGRYVALQKAGRNYRALCPFHSERTPSFYVFPERQGWYCFGACASGGDVITFVMKREGLEFRDALRQLAERAGVPLGPPRDQAADAQRERLREANAAAARFYYQQLYAAEGTAALTYVEGRGLDAEAIAAFQLGYSPDSWDSLRGHLASRGFSQETLLAAGLLVEGERGPYDRFRGRLMFPIQDDRGRVVGFGARALPPAAGPPSAGDDSHPKYLNTPQTPVFDKGSLLYGLHRAREEIRKEDRVVIVEGYMDVIAAHQHGLGNVVASMGTSLTERQVALLKRHTRNLVLALDADAAGGLATEHGKDVATAAADRISVPVPDWRGVVRHQEVLQADIRVATLPPGSDPDDFIRRDREGWTRLISDALTVLDHKMEVVSQRMTDSSTPAARAAAARELVPELEMVADPVKQAAYVQQLARRLRLDRAGEETVLRAIRRSRGGTRPPERPKEQSSPRELREEFCLALLLRYPSLRGRGLDLDGELFSLAENREVFAAWRAAASEGGWEAEGVDGTEEAETASGGPGSFSRHVEAVRSRLPEELASHLDRVLSRPTPPYSAGEAGKALDNCLWGIEQRKLELRKQASSLALAETEERLGPARLVEGARAILEGASPAPSEGDPVSQGAALLVQDAEEGRRLHGRRLDTLRPVQPSGSPPVDETGGSEQGP